MIFREFFYLRKSDRKVILTLLCVIVIALLVIFLTGGEQETSNALAAADSLQNDSLSQRQAPRSRYHRVDTVYLKPRYIRYASNGRRERTEDRRGSQTTDSLVHIMSRHKIAEGELVDLATADTTVLMTVPGIGSYYARRIVQYGERLGGYVSVSQLDEIGDLPEATRRYMTIISPNPKKLNVNRLSLNELRRHPYINFYQAKAITDYRRLHGNLKSLNELRLSKDFPQDAIERLLPYVEY